MSLKLGVFSSSGSFSFCWDATPWTSKLPSAAPAAAQPADLTFIPIDNLKEATKAPIAAPSAAPPVLSQVLSTSGCQSWFAVFLYETKSRKLCCKWCYYTNY